MPSVKSCIFNRLRNCVYREIPCFCNKKCVEWWEIVDIYGFAVNYKKNGKNSIILENKLWVIFE